MIMSTRPDVVTVHRLYCYSQPGAVGKLLHDRIVKCVCFTTPMTRTVSALITGPLCALFHFKRLQPSSCSSVTPGSTTPLVKKSVPTVG